MVDWYLSEQARDAVRRALGLAREHRHGWLGTEHLLAAILSRWDDEHVGGVALLRSCGLSGAQVPELVTELLQRGDAAAETAVVDPHPNPAVRFALAQAVRISAEARDAYVGTEHLVLALLWEDAAAELRLRGVTYARAAEALAALPRVEQPVRGEAIEPLEVVAVPTPAAARVAELARQQAEQYPIEGDGRVSTLHYLLALCMGGTTAGAVLAELGVTSRAVLERLDVQGARLHGLDDQRDELPLSGWARFEVARDEWGAAGDQVGETIRELVRQGVRFGVQPQGERFSVSIHPGESGLRPGAILDRLLGRASGQ